MNYQPEDQDVDTEDEKFEYFAENYAKEIEDVFNEASDFDDVSSKRTGKTEE